VDRLYGGRFMGRKTQATQPLAWPRSPTSFRNIDLPDGMYSVDADGNYRDLNVVQPEVKEAVCEMALAFATGYTPYVQAAPAVTEETKKVDVLQTTKKYDGAFTPKKPTDFTLDLILRPILLPAGPKVVFTA